MESIDRVTKPGARRPRIGWVGRAAGAGVFAGLVGMGYGTTIYLQQPGAMRVHWDLMFPLAIAFGLLAGLLGGLGLGGGMVLSAGRSPRRASFGRIMTGAVLGTTLGAFIPGVVGIVGFGSVRAPYAGTANIASGILLASTIFVAVFGPALSRGRGFSLLARVLASAAASIASAVTVGGLGWLLVDQFNLVPDLPWLQQQALSMGLVELAAISSVLVGAIVGVFVGFATWLYLSLELLLSRSSS